MRWLSYGRRTLARCGLVICSILLALWLLSTFLGSYWRFRTWGGWSSGGLIGIERITVGGNTLNQSLPGPSDPVQESRRAGGLLRPDDVRVVIRRPSLGLLLPRTGGDLEDHLIPGPVSPRSGLPDSFHVFVSVSWIAVPFWLPTLIAAATTTFLFRWSRRSCPPGHCHVCGYSLTGNTSGVCPECGTAGEFPPAETEACARCNTRPT